MIEKIYEQLKPMQERMHRKSKNKFRAYLKQKAIEVNLDYKILPKSGLSKNVIIGNIETAKYILGAHYDTPPKMPAFLVSSILLFNIVVSIFTIFLVLITFLNPNISYISLILIFLLLLHLFGGGIANKHNHNDNTSGILTVLALLEKNCKSDQVAYVFFDNEEKGLIGSMQLERHLRKILNTKNKQFIVFDCVGCGDVMGLTSYNSNDLANKILSISEMLEDKSISYIIKKPSMLMLSDHYSFRLWKHVGIMCYNSEGKRLKIKNIHSSKDKEVNINNIESLVKIISIYLEEE